MLTLFLPVTGFLYKTILFSAMIYKKIPITGLIRATGQPAGAACRRTFPVHLDGEPENHGPWNSCHPDYGDAGSGHIYPLQQIRREGHPLPVRQHRLHGSVSGTAAAAPDVQPARASYSRNRQ